MFFSLFMVAFVSATLWPMASEVVFVGLLSQNPDAVSALLAVATIGNTLGAWLTFECARHFSGWARRKLQKNQRGFEYGLAKVQTYGALFMLFAWLPVVGDLLPLVGGLLKIRRLPTVLCLMLGKGLRYGVLAGAFFGWDRWF